MSSEQLQLLSHIANQQQEILARTNANQIQLNNQLIREADAEERMKIVNKMFVSVVLQNTPTDLQCQFCKQHVRTNIEMSTLKDEMTAQQKQQFENLKRIMCYVPCFWCLLPCALPMFNAQLNMPVAQHQCPNCKYWIGMSIQGTAHYCTIIGRNITKEIELDTEEELVNWREEDWVKCLGLEVVICES